MTALSNRSPRGRLYRALGGRAGVPVGLALEGVPGREQRGLRERAADELQADGQAERIETAGNDERRHAEIVDPARQPRERSEEHTSELQSRLHLVCRLLLEKKKQTSFRPVRRTIVEV